MDEFLIPVPASIEAPLAMPLDVAIDLACEKLGLPSLGGPSGQGWSYYSTAQRCPHLFREQHIVPVERAIEVARLSQTIEGAHDVTPAQALAAFKELRAPAVPLQVGGLYHALQALYYGHGLGEAIYHERGLIQRALAPRKAGRPKVINIAADAADQLLAELRKMAEPLAEDLAASVEGREATKRPSAAIVYEAERVFDAHSAYYGAGREDVEPLAIEWRAVNEALAYTCRYDAIMRVGANHPLCDGKVIKAGSTVIYERKTSAYLSKMATDGWLLDGEVLGEILNWKPGGCEELFGPLAAVIVDIVTKGKSPQFLQVVVPADLPTVAEHARWIKWTQGELAMYQAAGVYPKRLTQCFDRWGQCGEWANCARGAK